MEGNDYIFGSYLKNLRKRRNVSTEALAQGCCDGSLIRKIEAGKRKASYNLRTLLIERLGQDSCKYENILNLNEYREVCARREILDVVVNKRIDEAKELLNIYYQEYAGADKLCLQFYYEILGRISEDKADCFCYLGQGSDPGVPQLFTNFQLNKGGIFCREQRENNVSPEFTM